MAGVPSEPVTRLDPLPNDSVNLNIIFLQVKCVFLFSIEDSWIMEIPINITDDLDNQGI